VILQAAVREIKHLCQAIKGLAQVFTRVISYPGAQGQGTLIPIRMIKLIISQYPQIVGLAGDFLHHGNHGLTFHIDFKISIKHVFPGFPVDRP